MRKTSIVCAAVLSGMLVLTGCGSTVPEMTKEESNMISEYAAELLLKYDKNYVSRVVDTTEYHKELERIAEEERKAQEAAAAEQARLEAEALAAAEAENSSGASTGVKTVSSIEEFYQLQGVSIQYGGYGVYDSYPEQVEGEEMFFSLNATAGKRFLVLFFDVTNISGADMEFNMIGLSPKFRISVNGGLNKPAMLSSVPEELPTYKGNISAGETVRTVVIAEISAQESEGINSLTLTLKGADGSAQLPLQ